MKKEFIKLIVMICGFVLVLAACKKADDYKKYLVDGEIIYPAKADSIVVSSGDGRIMLSWVKSDPKVTNYIVYWNLGGDSLSVGEDNVMPLLQGDTVRVTIDGLEEANYEFEVIAEDSDNNRSIKSFVGGRVYGEMYKAGLMSRMYRGATFIGTDDFVTVWWYNADSTDVEQEITYINQQNIEVVKQVDSEDLSSIITGYKEGTQIRIRSGYLPHKNAIDTFYTDYHIIEPLKRSLQLDKSKFLEYSLPGDVSSAWGWGLPYLWDNNINEGRGFHTPDVTAPVHFNIDLGIKTNLQQLKVWQRQSQPFDGGNLRKFEIWGSNEPSSNGSYEGWIKLLECNSVKPSGLPVGSVSDEDKALVAAGELFVFPVGTPAVRYVRVRFIDNWSEESNSFHMMETTFWGSQE